jgi:hypothetical protein
MYIEEGDDVVIQFNKKTAIEVFESEDFELNESVEEIFEADEQVEVTVFGVDDIKLDVQFGDGSIAFIHRNQVKVISINDELV